MVVPLPSSNSSQYMVEKQPTIIPYLSQASSIALDIGLCALQMALYHVAGQPLQLLTALLEELHPFEIFSLHLSTLLKM